MQAPITIPNFKLEAELGHGGMSRVYRAQQLQPRREVAVKIVQGSAAGEDRFMEVLQREGDMIASLRHQHIITIYQCGVIDHCFFMAMELLPGGDLEARIKAGMRPGAAVEVMQQIGSALEHAHRKGVWHRDIKPGNVMFDEYDRAVLVDFGIAKQEHTKSAYTLAGAIVGTPHYLSPERCLGKPADHRSDLYAMGVLFYEMLTGSKLFDGRTAEVGMAHVQKPPPPLPPALARFQPIVQKLLEKLPERRYQSARELLDALRQLPVELPPPIPVVKPPLAAGGNVNLSQQSPGLKRVIVRLGWEASASSDVEFDLDASAFLTDADGKVRSDADFIFYNNPSSSEGAVRHMGDERRGASADGGDGGDGETIHVDLELVPADIENIMFVVSVHDGDARGQNFGQVRNANIRIYNQDDQRELAHYALGGDLSKQTALIVGQLFRASGEWKFRAVGQGFRGGLGLLALKYGVEVD